MVMRVTSRGFLEILQMADGGESKAFTDFTKIFIKKRRLSSATVSKRLNDLLSAGAIDMMVSESKLGRRTITYRTTEKGRKLIKLGKEFEEALSFR